MGQTKGRTDGQIATLFGLPLLYGRVCVIRDRLTVDESDDIGDGTREAVCLKYADEVETVDGTR